MRVCYSFWFLTAAERVWSLCLLHTVDGVFLAEGWSLLDASSAMLRHPLKEKLNIGSYDKRRAVMGAVPYLAGIFMPCCKVTTEKRLEHNTPFGGMLDCEYILSISSSSW